MTHTPGPWKVVGEIYSNVIIETEAEMPEQEHQYGKQTVVGSSEWTFVRAEDAHLISAAPDLLDALEKILRAHKSGNNGAYMGEASLCRYFEKMAECAISKARGVK